MDLESFKGASIFGGYKVMKKLVISFIITLLLVPCLSAQTVATVGGNRIATEAAYGNTSVNPSQALISLINDALEQKVAAEEVSELSNHADTRSKAPEILAKIKAAFGSDVASYNRIYLAPKIVSSRSEIVTRASQA